MRTSIATVCISGTLEQKMLACAKAGFDGNNNYTTIGHCLCNKQQQ